MSNSEMQTTTSSSRHSGEEASISSPESFGVPVIRDDPHKKFPGEWVKIGQGGTGEVFSCFDFDGKQVAIKITKESDAINKENLIWSNLNSDHIVELIEVYIWEYVVYAVMELMQSILTDIIPNPRKHMPFLPTMMLLRIIRDLILAVKYLHENWISHGDLKSDNVLLDASGKVKLADFGVSTQHGEIHPNTPCCGTSQWKPPNAMKKETASPFKDDIWSLGIVILELFGVDPPFLYEADPFRIMYKISHLQAPPPLPNLKFYGEDFELRMHGLLGVCLQLNPAERFSAEQLLILFEENFQRI